LAWSRIYIKRQRYYYFSADPVPDPRTGKVSKWHSLCDLKEGEMRARELAAAIQRGARAIAGSEGKGDMPEYVQTYLLDVLRKRDMRRPRDPARARMFAEGNAKISSACKLIGQGFEDFDVCQPTGADVAQFVDQWAGQRAAQVYLGRLSDFFRWAIRRGLRTDNPCLNIRVEKPEARRRYITDQEWHAVMDALLVGKDGRETSSGKMVRVYASLCYLLYQRTTEIRLLQWSQIDYADGVIRFTPTKTERSSGVSVDVPITQEVREQLEHARKLCGVKSLYVIHTGSGKPYTAHGLGSAWRRACERAGVEDATLKDIRAKAATDAKRMGYTKKEISVGLAHTGEGMTEQYLRGRDAERSSVELRLPKQTKAG